MRRFPALLALPLLVFASCAQSPDKLVLAREVIKAIEAEKMIEAIIPELQQMNTQATQQMAAQNGFTAEESAQLAKLGEKCMAVSMEAIRGLMPAMEGIYVEVYSMEELQAMKKFYTSPEGRSMLQKQPELVKRLSPKIQDAVLATQPRIQQLLQQEAARILAGRKAKAG